MSEDRKHDELVSAIRSTRLTVSLLGVVIALVTLGVWLARIANALNRIAEALQ